MVRFCTEYDKHKDGEEIEMTLEEFACGGEETEMGYECPECGKQDFEPDEEEYVKEGE